MLSKCQQAKILEDSLDSGQLLEVTVTPWNAKNETTSLQSRSDKCYHYKWSNKSAPRPMEMEETDIKMQDIRNLLDVRSMARKIDKRSMLRLGDIGERGTT